jgi:hypothetical protein
MIWEGGRDADEDLPLNREWLAPDPRLWIRDAVTLGLAVFNAVAWPVLLWMVIAP